MGTERLRSNVGVPCALLGLPFTLYDSLLAVLIVETAAMEQRIGHLPPDVPDGNARKVYLVDIVRTQSMKRNLQKRSNNQALHHMLQSCGYDVIMLAMLLGFSGTIYRSTLQCMHRLGTVAEKKPKLLSALHVYASLIQPTLELRRYLARNRKNNKRKYSSKRFQALRAEPPWGL